MPHESHSNAILARRAQKDPSVEAPYYIRLYFEAQDNLWYLPTSDACIHPLDNVDRHGQVCQESSRECCYECRGE